MTNSERFTTTQFGIDPEDLRVIERIARERRVSRAVILREAVDFWLNAKVSCPVHTEASKCRALSAKPERTGT